MNLTKHEKPYNRRLQQKRYNSLIANVLIGALVVLCFSWIHVLLIYFVAVSVVVGVESVAKNL